MEKIKLFLLIAVFQWGSLCSWSVSDFSYDKDWPYQDIWINGEVLMKGCGPDCPSRFEALRPILNRFKRPFSVLEIGANNGYFCFRIANEYDATCVMMDGTDRLRKLCEANSSLRKIVYLKSFVNSNDLMKLAKIEHFDVVLCFHVLHHVDWRPFLDALFELGDHVIIETPPVNDGFVSLKPLIPEIARHLLSIPYGIQIGSFSRQSPEIKDHMILFSNPSQTYDFETSSRIPGISLSTFNSFNGVYPIVWKYPDRWKEVAR